jgi:hypothetical protein
MFVYSSQDGIDLHSNYFCKKWVINALTNLPFGGYMAIYSGRKIS